MSWNFSNDVPIYLQIMEHFKVQIASGKLAVGDKIPPVRELALEAGVNPQCRRLYQSLKEKVILNHREHLEG